MKETKVYTGRRNGKHAELMQRLDKTLKEQHFAFVFTKQELKERDQELVKEVCEKISIELENETETYCEIRQCSSPHYQGDYVWFNYVKFRKLAEKLQKEFEDE